MHSSAHRDVDMPQISTALLKNHIACGRVKLSLFQTTRVVFSCVLCLFYSFAFGIVMNVINVKMLKTATNHRSRTGRE